jgi:hypothetical protein
LCARPPFVGDTVEVLAAQLRDTPMPPRALDPSLPPWLDEMITRLLEKDPGRRLQSCAQVIEVLDHGARQGWQSVPVGRGSGAGVAMAPVPPRAPQVPAAAASPPAIAAPAVAAPPSSGSERKPAASGSTERKPAPSRSQFDELLAQSQEAVKQGSHAKAQRLCRQALEIQPREPCAVDVCAVAACNLGNAAQARSYYAMASGERQAKIHRFCLAKGIVLAR